MGAKPRPTRKLAVQLTTTAIEVAVGRPEGREGGPDMENVMSVARASRVKLLNWGKILAVNILSFVENVLSVMILCSFILEKCVGIERIYCEKWSERAYFRIP